MKVRLVKWFKENYAALTVIAVGAIITSTLFLTGVNINNKIIDLETQLELERQNNFKCEMKLEAKTNIIEISELTEEIQEKLTQIRAQKLEN